MQARHARGQSATELQADPVFPPDLAAPLLARVLIVDADVFNAQAALQALEPLGHELVAANSGEEALRRLAAEDFALILLDLHMPDLDGYETAARIRAQTRSRDTPMVFLTATPGDEAHVFQAYSAGAVDVVVKPVNPLILKAKVTVLTSLYLKTEELKRQSAYQQRLLDEHIRVRAERDEHERALKVTEARQEAILRSLPIVFTARSVEPPFAPHFVSDRIADITGFPAERYLEDPDFGLSRIHPEDLQGVTRALQGVLRTGSYSCEFRWRCADGTYRVLHDQGVLAPALEDQPREIFGVILDATDRKSLEEQVAQARKMEAVGQLTGGVAHDFNNLLTVVLGNVDMMDRRGLQEDEARRTRRIDAIRQAAERGRDLTRQLLAFSRRQHLVPATLDPNALIREFVPLMRQVVGEAVTIQLDLAAAAPNVHVDATQLETALLNLAVNARDAMGGAGLLSISTAVEGNQLLISVRDTGCGMTAAVRDRVFEPFFTTKDVGKGSGLGLSQVYGFVRQSEGDIQLETRPGEGATFRLKLPVVAGKARPERTRRAPKVFKGGSERILLVEDDLTVLAMTLDVLAGLGYQVTTATSAIEALKVLETDAEVDLLFTDVMMSGGMDGVQLARSARELRPDLQVLLTSGFVGEQQDGVSDFPLLDKPFETAELARTLRRLMDRPAAGRKGRRTSASKAAP